MLKACEIVRFFVPGAEMNMTVWSTVLRKMNRPERYV